MLETILRKRRLFPQAEQAMTWSDPFLSHQLLKPKLYAINLDSRGPKCISIKGTAQILLPTAISIVSTSQARLKNYQKNLQIYVRKSHEILMETNEPIWALKARNLWWCWPIAC